MNVSKEYDIYVEEDIVGSRIDKYLSDYFHDMSRSFIQKMIKDGNVYVNEKNVKANYKLCVNDYIHIIVPLPQTLDIKAENIPIDIVYEDNDIIIVNKAKDMVVHPAPGHTSNTLVNALLYHCGNNLSGINGVLRPGIVHRIDKDTTGLLVVCKNDIAHNSLAEQLSTHSIKRTYHAIACGNIPDDSGTIVKPLGRDVRDRKKMAVVANGKEAITHYKVINRLRNQRYNENLTYIQCNLETGRTHQIRVHMSSMSHPLLGDEVYGYKKCHYATNGQTLHAKTLGFIHPTTNEYIEFDSELPDYFCNIINKCEIL